MEYSLLIMLLCNKSYKCILRDSAEYSYNNEKLRGIGAQAQQAGINVLLTGWLGFRVSLGYYMVNRILVLFRDGYLTFRFYECEIALVIKGIVRGKSSGHDDLNIENLKYAGNTFIIQFFFLSCK